MDSGRARLSSAALFLLFRTDEKYEEPDSRTSATGLRIVTADRSSDMVRWDDCI